MCYPFSDEVLYLDVPSNRHGRTLALAAITLVTRDLFYCEFPFVLQDALNQHLMGLVAVQGDYAGAMLERALFALESAWHPQFKSLMLNGKARLPVAQGKNALFFRTTYQKMRLLIRRGCPRTALEWGKMILSLDPEDPCGILFQMDYCALRSRQYESIFEPPKRAFLNEKTTRAANHSLLPSNCVHELSHSTF